MFPKRAKKEERKLNSLFPLAPVIDCFVLLYLLTQKSRKLHKKICYGRHKNLSRFQRARPDHVRVQRSSYCFPWEFTNFDPWHVTRSPPIGINVFELRGTTKYQSDWNTNKSKNGKLAFSKFYSGFHWNVFCPKRSCFLPFLSKVDRVLKP